MSSEEDEEDGHDKGDLEVRIRGGLASQVRSSGGGESKFRRRNEAGSKSRNRDVYYSCLPDLTRTIYSCCDIAAGPHLERRFTSGGSSSSSSSPRSSSGGSTSNNSASGSANHLIMTSDSVSEEKARSILKSIYFPVFYNTGRIMDFKKTSFLRFLMFSWLTPLVSLCHRLNKRHENLDQDRAQVLPELPHYDASALQYASLKREWDRELEKCRYNLHGETDGSSESGSRSKSRPSLVRALIRAFYREAMVGWTGFLFLIYDLLHLVSPVLLNVLLRWIKETHPRNPNLGWYLAAGISATSLLQAFLLAHYFQRSELRSPSISRLFINPHGYARFKNP